MRALSERTTWIRIGALLFLTPRRWGVVGGIGATHESAKVFEETALLRDFEYERNKTFLKCPVAS